MSYAQPLVACFCVPQLLTPDTCLSIPGLANPSSHQQPQQTLQAGPLGEEVQIIQILWQPVAAGAVIPEAIP